MPRTSRSLRLFAVAVVLSLTMVPMAGARPAESPAIHESEGGWFGAALKWVEDAIGIRRPDPAGHGRRSGQEGVSQRTEKTSLGGSCIDPQGYPKPCPR